MSHKEVSAQESAYKLLAILLRQSTRFVVFVNNKQNDKRVQFLKARSHLEMWMMLMRILITQISKMFCLFKLLIKTTLMTIQIQLYLHHITFNLSSNLNIADLMHLKIFAWQNSDYTVDYKNHWWLYRWNFI